MLISIRVMDTRVIFERLVLSYIVFMLLSLAASGMPASFYQAMASMDTSNYLCVKNYDAGASVTESYSDFDHLEKETEITSQSFHPTNSSTNGTRSYAALDAWMSSSFSGKAHISWQSRDLNPGLKGRHATHGMVQEDVIGVWKMERFIHLSSNHSLLCRPDWLACSE